MVYIYKKTVRNAYGKKYTYFYLCESFRGLNGKPTHRVIKYLGRNIDKKEVLMNIDTYIQEYNERKSELNTYLRKLDAEQIEKLTSMDLYLGLVEHMLLANKFAKQENTFVNANVVVDPQKFSVFVGGKEGEVKIGADDFDKEFLKNLHIQIKAAKGELSLKDMEY